MEKGSQTPRGTPGMALRKLFMEPLGLSAYRLALDLEVPPIAVSQILRGKRAISAGMALRLGRYFGVPADFWLALQAGEDLVVAVGETSLDSVQRCSELRGRAFVLRESMVQGRKNWEVLLASGKEAAQGSVPRKSPNAAAAPAHNKTPVKRAGTLPEAKSPVAR